MKKLTILFTLIFISFFTISYGQKKNSLDTFCKDFFEDFRDENFEDIKSKIYTDSIGLSFLNIPQKKYDYKKQTECYTHILQEYGRTYLDSNFKNTNYHSSNILYSRESKTKDTNMSIFTYDITLTFTFPDKTFYHLYLKVIQLNNDFLITDVLNFSYLTLDEKFIEVTKKMPLHIFNYRNERTKKIQKNHKNLSLLASIEYYDDDHIYSIRNIKKTPWEKYKTTVLHGEQTFFRIDGSISHKELYDHDLIASARIKDNWGGFLDSLSYNTVLTFNHFENFVSEDYIDSVCKNRDFKEYYRQKDGWYANGHEGESHQIWNLGSRKLSNKCSSYGKKEVTFSPLLLGLEKKSAQQFLSIYYKSDSLPKEYFGDAFVYFQDEILYQLDNKSYPLTADTLFDELIHLREGYHHWSHYYNNFLIKTYLRCYNKQNDSHADIYKNILSKVSKDISLTESNKEYCKQVLMELPPNALLLVGKEAYNLIYLNNKMKYREDVYLIPLDYFSPSWVESYLFKKYQIDIKRYHDYNNLKAGINKIKDSTISINNYAQDYYDVILNKEILFSKFYVVEKAKNEKWFYEYNFPISLDDHPFWNQYKKENEIKDKQEYLSKYLLKVHYLLMLQKTIDKLQPSEIYISSNYPSIYTPEGKFGTGFYLNKFSEAPINTEEIKRIDHMIDSYNGHYDDYFSALLLVHLTKNHLHNTVERNANLIKKYTELKKDSLVNSKNFQFTVKTMNLCYDTKNPYLVKPFVQVFEDFYKDNKSITAIIGNNKHQKNVSITEVRNKIQKLLYANSPKICKKYYPKFFQQQKR